MYVRRFLDRFEDSQITPPLVSSPKNGTVVEAGTEIQLTAPAATDCRWWTEAKLAPAAYMPDFSAFPEATLNEREGSALSLLSWETRLTLATFTPVDDAPKAGLVVFVDYDNAYQLSYDFSSEYVTWQKIVGGTGTSIADTGGNTADPNVTPKRFRMVYNPRASATVYLGTQAVAAGEIAALYSEDDGATWTYLSKETLGIDRAHLGAAVYLKRSIDNPTSEANAKFDYLETGHWYLTKDDLQTTVIEDVLNLPTVGGFPKHSDNFNRGTGLILPGPATQPTDQLQDTMDQGAFEDPILDLPTAGGAPKYQSPEFPRTGRIGVGQRLPGIPDLPATDSVVPENVGYLEDVLEFPPATGPTSYHEGIPEGQYFSGSSPYHQRGGIGRARQTGFEDRMYFRLGGPPMDYPKDTQDADGNYFLGGYQATHVIFYDPSTDAFGETHVAGDGFYGAGRNGAFYYDGAVCGFGDFGTVVDGVRHTAWGYSDNDPQAYGTAPSWTVTVPVDGEIRLMTTGATSEGVNVASAHRWYVEGDFDVEIEWYDYVMTGSAADGGAYFEVHSDTNHYAYVRRRTPGSDRVDSSVKLNGSWGAYTEIPTSVVTGKFRFTRSGDVLRRYYDIGGGWVQIGGDETFGTDRVFFRVGFWSNGTLTAGDIKFKNLTVNSGGISNTAGWASEAFGAHRGNRNDFPAHAVIATTDDSIDIIDVDENKLWMRFVQAENNVIDTWGSGIRPRRLAMKEGVLLVALSDYSSEGGLLRIDFNLDEVRIHRGETSSITGAVYKTPHGATNWGRDCAPGIISGRNSAKDWGGDYNTWKLQGYPTQGTDLWFDSGFEYRAAAGSGLSLFKWRRWYFQGLVPNTPNDIYWAWSNETDRMYWCYFRDNGELMYMDDVNVYSVFNGTYETRLLGGFAHVFPADQSKALPGTRTYDVQKVLVPYSTSYFYLPADEGVFRVDWPVGSFLHMYGPPGSGASHEIIPANHIVMGVVIGDDGGSPVLVLTLYDQTLGTNRLMAINIVGDTVHSLTPVATGNVQYSESAA